jgi:hypothetical protein
MSLLRKPLDAITIADLDALVDAGARETGELEFKGTLPFQPQKNQPEKSDRWIEKGDRVGDYARDEILAEIVAFANADGGTLVLGLHETKTEPRVAERLEPLPNCEGLAQRLLDTTEDVIEPRLAAINVRAVLASDDGTGYVLMRVGKSLSGPHRLSTTREFYVRRNERASRMSVREIKDRTLELARQGDQIRLMLNERRASANDLFASLMDEPSKGIPPLLVRVTAFPASTQDIPDITQNQKLWWQGGAFKMTVDGTDYTCEYPSREFNDRPSVRLRSLVSQPNSDREGSFRLLRADGLVEFCLVHPTREPFRGNSVRLYWGWLIGLLAATVSQVDRLRTLLAWDSIEYGLEVEVWAVAPLVMMWNDRQFQGGTEVKDDLPLKLPLYSLSRGEDYDSLISMIVRDIFNACGSSTAPACVVPWKDLIGRVDEV